MDTKKAAKYIGLSPKTLGNYAAMGVIKAQKIDGLWYFAKADLDAYQPKETRPRGLYGARDDFPSHWSSRDVWTQQEASP
jgi:hypothetical protein